MPWPSPSQVVCCDISAVHCVIARTKTRSKKSSSGSTRSSWRSDAPSLRRCVSLPSPPRLHLANPGQATSMSSAEAQLGHRGTPSKLRTRG